jgi:hypothetical protein
VHNFEVACLFRLALEKGSASLTTVEGEVTLETCHKWLCRDDQIVWVGCVTGSLEENDYPIKLAAVGFKQIDLEPTRVYNVDDARESPAGQNFDMGILLASDQSY